MILRILLALTVSAIPPTIAYATDDKALEVRHDDDELIASYASNRVGLA